MMNAFPPVAMALILVAVLVGFVIFIVGFSKHGVNFLKYGFKQIILDSFLEKRFDAKLTANINALDAKIVAIETNHFAHLKNFLTELTSILLDKGVINNTDKARLDNELRGM
ncbi:hypothetical protein AGMMS4952_11510 [Spirochaetia bacterium]|nr:hypothetical protein AGMMS4952_11510 [Spirochaetia bacterium]